jgi:hypothetical protein
MKMARDLSGMLQDMYAERLSKFYVLHVNWFYKMMWAMTKPMLAKKTKEKIEIVGNPKQLLKYFDPPQLVKEYGGTSDYVCPFPIVSSSQ